MQTHTTQAERDTAAALAHSLTNAALAHRLHMIAANPTVFQGIIRDAYLREAADRLDP